MPAARRRRPLPAIGSTSRALGLPMLLAAGALWPTLPLIAQEATLEGRWTGALTILGSDLGFSVDFTGSGAELAATMDIPTQGARGLPLTEVSEDGLTVHFELQAGPGLAVWHGDRAGDVIEGTFTQGGAAGTFTMAREGSAAAETDEADEPVPYRQQDLVVENGSVRLEGTLTLPEADGPFPAVVMATGSGAQNRDEELFGFRPFRVIADYLTRRGIAVFRHDDRGVGGSSGNVALSTTSDLADDALAAIAMLASHEEIDAGRIGIIGHSEGGVVAPIAASRSDAVSFVVLLAGTSVPGEEVIYEQGEAIARVAGQSPDQIADGLEIQRRIFAAIREERDIDEFRRELETIIREQIADASEEDLSVVADRDQFVTSQANQQIAQVNTPWFRYFLTLDPAGALRQTTVPVLALFGELDLQVTPSQNRPPMAEALGRNPDVTIHTLPGANHLFQSAITGSPAEYATLEKEFVPGFLELIGDWVIERTGTGTRPNN